MAIRHYCQSCSMPIDAPAIAGTERDGTLSTEYCIYCYQHGEYIHPGLTLNDMRRLVELKLKELNIGDNILQQALLMLPTLKRWKSAEPEVKAL